jgi:hypothetical protein
MRALTVFRIRYRIMAQSPTASQSSDDQLGEVAAILASRSSTTLGCPEVLVVWEPSWIPITNVRDGPILSKYLGARKCNFVSAAGKLLLPVESDSVLARDIAAAAERTERHLELQAQQDRGTPRKSLGSVAKRAMPSEQTSRDSKKQ